MLLSRRSFLRRTFFIAGILSACRKEQELDTYDTSESILTLSLTKKISLSNRDRLLFIGDSITDASRDRTISSPNQDKGLGNGFVKQVATELLGSDEFANVQIYNRGYAGYATEDLVALLDGDKLDLAISPEVVSILIGVNDLRRNNSPQHYYFFYKDLLSKMRQRLPTTEIVLCEPFLLSNASNYEAIQPNLHEYKKVVRTLARDFKTVFIPYNDYFWTETKVTSIPDLLTDGIHPTDKGIELITRKWLSWLGD